MDDIIKIDLKSEASMILKVGYMARAGIFLIGTMACIYGAVNIIDESVVAFIVICPIIAFLAILFFRIIAKAFMKEYIVMTKSDISIIRKFLIIRKTVKIRLDDLVSIRHQTEESEYEEPFQEGNIVVFRRNGRALRFGRGLPSWDADHIIRQVEYFISMYSNGRDYSGEEN